MLSIAHIINPVKADESLDLFWAQPITFAAVHTAKEFAKESVSVSLYSAQYPEDADVVPGIFAKTKDLERSVLDLAVFKKRRKFPLLRDILERLYHESSADWLVYSNCDIAPLPYFYLSVAKLIEQGHDAFVINRRTIPASYKETADIPMMYAEVGEPHKGFDCFVFKRELYPQFELEEVCVGSGAVGRVLVWNLATLAKKFAEFKDLHLTFHIGNERIWQKEEYADYWHYNRRQARAVLEKLDEKFHSTGRLERLGYLGTFKTHKFVFVVGLHRSGTTVLADCLKEHPKISGFSNTGVPKDEGQFLQGVFPPAKQFGGPGKFGFKKAMHLTENSSLATPANGQKIFAEWGRYWDLQSPLLLEKSPPNILKTRFLQSLFPDSYFIFISRHPIATAYATQKWSKTTIRSLLKHWLACHTIFEQDRKYLKNLYTLKYEDFAKNPDLYLKEIYRFLGIDDHKRTVAVQQGLDEKYLSCWQARAAAGSRLRQYLSRLKYKRIEKKIARFGYSLYPKQK